MFRLEIKPVPTQKERKLIKGIQFVKKVETNAGQAWVLHTAFEENESAIAGILNSLGFRVKGLATVG